MQAPLQVAVEPLTPDSFAPFGEVIGPSTSEPDFLVDWVRGRRLAYDTDSATDLLFMEYCSVPLECELVERHFAVTQAFIPLDGTPSVMVVAAPGGPAEVPVPVAFRAFAVPGSSGIMLWRGTWHAVTRYPLRSAGGKFALITGRETQLELAHASNGGPRPKLTETMSFVERYQTKLTIVDPHGLLCER